MRARFFALNVSLIFLLAPLTTAASYASWPMFQHDGGHAGYTDAESHLNIQNITLLWSLNVGVRLTSPVAEDINEDGFLEVVFGSINGNLYVLDHDGKVAWAYKTGEAVASTPAVGDIDGDGVNEIVFNTLDRRIHVLKYMGGEVWNQTVNENKDLMAPLALADVNYDKIPEIIAGREVFNSSGARLNYSRSQLKDAGVSVLTPVGEEYVVADLDDNGILDEIGNIFKGSGYVIPAVADVNNDGRNEIVFWGGRPMELMHLSPESLGSAVRNEFVLYLLNSSKDILWKHTIPKITPPVVADLDGCGLKEIIFGVKNELRILDSSGYSLRRFKFDSNVNLPPAVADLDNDGNLEIIAVSDNGVVNVFGSREFNDLPKTRPRVILLANSIDYPLSSDINHLLRDRCGLNLIHVDGESFSGYRREKYVFILGGQNSPENVGGIVGSLLTENERNYLKASKISSGVFTRKNIWSDDQVVKIFAGYDEYQTRRAHRENSDEILFIKYCKNP